MEALKGLVISSGPTVSICFSARPDSYASRVADRRLTISHRLSMTNPERDADINGYILTEVQRRNTMREQPLDKDMEVLVIDQLALGA